jgi:hypothetical protein
MRRGVLALVKKKYGGSEEERFGPTLAAEHLREEDGIAIDHETLRRWLLEEGMWSRQRTRKVVRKRRERKAHFGELVQMDGSFHDWLEGRGPRGCLMNLVDDARGVTECRMGKEETIWAAVRGLRVWIEKYGVPCALYTDWKNVYKRKAMPGERLRGEAPLMQFGKMCAKLGIEIIAASSPQAKGRVERNHGTHQDRLVKKIRRQQLASYEAANDYLEREFTGAQPALRGCGGCGGRLSLEQTQLPRAGRDFSFGNPARHRQRLGDPASRTDAATASRPATRRTDTG